MNLMKKLPDAEFEIMKVVWANEPPITTGMVMEQLGKERAWKAQTIITLMKRLVERGFLRSEKKSKERGYFSLISKEEYLKFETGDFIQRFHGNSFSSLIAALHGSQRFKEDDLDELEKWLKEKRE
ncbi:MULTISPECIES: BlaI/MecI/CopY family transcriptional regulator [Paenibacillus]|uniref:BlaI/MecI/CopY family transcriptional regulator n=1 Tax=Paenibacillus TaxID=44249 RepID=UPI002FDF1CFD